MHTSSQPRRVEVIAICATGDGVVYGRTAAGTPQEAREGCELVLSQLDDGKGPRLLLAVAGVSGVCLYAERADLTLLLELARQDWCRWIAIRDYARLGRSRQVVNAFLKDLKDCNVTLRVLDHAESQPVEFRQQLLQGDAQSEQKGTM